MVWAVVHNCESIKPQVLPESTKRKQVGVTHFPIWAVVGQQNEMFSSKELTGQDLGQVVYMPV